MNDEDADKEFRTLVDSFIHLANGHADKTAHENVGMALLYAAARYNAFVVASHAPDLEKFEADRKTAFEFFQNQYKTMLKENLDDHRKFYDADIKYAHLMKNH
jgi:isopenicillin N synthase-like dioxygenase